jgi:Fe-S cluster assembly protein SufD
MIPRETQPLISNAELEKILISFESEDPSWFHQIRQIAREELKNNGFPDFKTEQGSYTPWDKVLLPLKFSGRPIERFSANTDLLSSLDWNQIESVIGQWPYRIVMLNGQYSIQHSILPSGLEIESIRSVLKNSLNIPIQSMFSKLNLKELGPVLNLACFKDGFYLHFKSNQCLDYPLVMLHIATQAQDYFSCSHNVIVMDEYSSGTILEYFISGNEDQSSLNSEMTQIYLRPQSQLAHAAAYLNGIHKNQWSFQTVEQQSGSSFSSRIFILGGAWTRHEQVIALKQPQASCGLEGLWMTQDHQQAENYTFIDHQAPNCTSREKFKGIANHDSVGVFDGCILVRENSMKTDASQENKNILLSSNAQIYSKPQLKIYADDVKCSHGSATGQLDAEALFYLQSRGIHPEAAQQMLIDGFSREIVDAIPWPEFKTSIWNRVNQFYKGNSK